MRVLNTFTCAFGTGMVATFGFLVSSCSAWTAKLTAIFADGLITCENAAEVAPTTALPPLAPEVIECVPRERDGVLIGPGPALTPALASDAIPSLKVAEPVAVV